MTISAIILVYHDEKYLHKCVSSLRESCKYAKVRLEIIIVVNDPELKKTGFQFPRNCTIIFNKKNLGFGKSINLAAKRAKGEWLGIINVDTVTKKTTLKYLLKHIYDKKVAIVAPKIIYSDGNLQFSILEEPTLWNIFKEQSYLYKLFPSIFHSNYVNKSLYKYSHKVNIVVGAYFIIKRKFFLKIGGFDKRFFIYFEDFDLCLRVRKTSSTIYFESNAVITHYEHKSFGGALRGDYYLLNLYHFLCKHHTQYYAFIGILIVLIGCFARLIYWKLRISGTHNHKLMSFGVNKIIFCKQVIKFFLNQPTVLD